MCHYGKSWCYYGNHPSENRQLWEEYQPHAQKLIKESDNDDSVHRMHLADMIGKSLLKNGRSEEAEDCLSRYVNLLYDNFGRADPKLLSYESWLARAYRRSGQPWKAIDILQPVMVKYERKMPKPDEDRPMAKSELGRSYQGVGLFKDAIKHLQHVVEVESQLLQPNPKLRHSRLTTQIQLALSYFADREFNEAIDRLEGILGTDDEDIARDDWLLVTP